ncbi:MAG: hypothetical protein KA275_04160 [Chitinophagaceae bacterium]|nr:hypothetical protein [Chitinophagaceae bacterium]
MIKTLPKFSILSLALFTLTFSVSAKNNEKPAKKESLKMMMPVVKKKKFFKLTSENEGTLLSLAMNFTNGTVSPKQAVRYSSFINTGFRLNHNFTKNIGFYTGFGLKNIGLIEKIGDSTVKRRTYNVGIPLALKIGNLSKTYFYLGGGLDYAFNYKEKGYIKRNDKEKFNEWNSNRVNKFQPFSFVGVALNNAFDIKFQYYPLNFFNEDYRSKNDMLGLAIYRNHNANLAFITLGFNMNKNSKSKKVKDILKEKTEVEDVDTM